MRKTQARKYSSDPYMDHADRFRHMLELTSWIWLQVEEDYTPVATSNLQETL